MEFIVQANLITCIVKIRLNKIKMDLRDCWINLTKETQNHGSDGKNVLLDDEHVWLADFGFDLAHEQGFTWPECAEHSFWCENKNLKRAGKHLQDGKIAWVSFRLFHWRVRIEACSSFKWKNWEIFKTVPEYHFETFISPKNGRRKLHCPKGTSLD